MNKQTMKTSSKAIQSQPIETDNNNDNKLQVEWLYPKLKRDLDEIKEGSVNYSLRKGVRDAFKRGKDFTLGGPDEEAQPLEESPAERDQMLYLELNEGPNNGKLMPGGKSEVLKTAESQ